MGNKLLWGGPAKGAGHGGPAKGAGTGGPARNGHSAAYYAKMAAKAERLAGIDEFLWEAGMLGVMPNHEGQLRAIDRLRAAVEYRNRHEGLPVARNVNLTLGAGDGDRGEMEARIARLSPEQVAQLCRMLGVSVERPTTLRGAPVKKLKGPVEG